MALNKSYSASSEIQNNFKSYAFDGNSQTRWESIWSDSHWLSVDLGQSYSIGRVVLHWEAAFGEEYDIQVSENGIQWTTVYQQTLGNGGIDELSLTAQGRYIRMFGIKRGTVYGYSLYEFEVYEFVEDDSNAYLSDLLVNGKTLTDFNQNEFDYEYVYESDGSEIPIITATPYNTGASVEITSTDVLPGISTVQVTSVDQTTTKIYSIQMTPSSYQLVWSDEFDEDGSLNSDKWHFQTIPIDQGGTSWANNEAQHYTNRSDNSWVGNGTLKIKAIKENYTDNNVTKSYTSARLNSKFTFQYGRIDVRAKLPAQAGTWPAIWTLGANINETGNYFGNTFGSVGWPACGEIDILEQNGWDKTKVIGHLHYANTITNQYQNEGGTTNVSDSSGTYHTYSLIWTNQSIKILLDDNVFFERENTNEIPFDNEHYILLNLAMGGNLGGNIPSNFTNAIMEIDFVRVYQLQALSMIQPEEKPEIFIKSNRKYLEVNANQSIEKLSVYDITGREVYGDSPNRLKVEIPVSLIKGVYIIKVQIDRRLFTKKVVVTH